MKYRFVTLLAIALVLSISLSAQQKTNFSGRWVQLTPAEGAGGEQVIRQTDTRITMNHDSSGGGHSLEYVLDGSETRSTMQSHGMDIVSVSRASWTGDKLTITTKTTYTPDRVMDQTMVWSIDEKGQFVIELTQKMTGRDTEKHTIVHKKL